MQTAEDAPARRARILIVEDEGLIARDIETRVKKAGYEVAGVVESGEEVLGRVCELRPDLILMDIRLRGDIDGIEAAAKIRRTADVPIIYLTAHTDAETLDRAKVTEPYGYLSKPLGRASLPSSIEIALHKHGIESELRRQRGWLKTTLRMMPDGVIVTDHRGRVHYMNPAAEELTGRTTSEVEKQPLAAILKLEEGGSYQSLEELQGAGERISFPPGAKLVTHSGERISVEGEISPSTEEGSTVGSVVTLRDVRTREREEQERWHDQKMQAVGRLAAGVAHDFNNFLTVILGNADLLKLEAKEAGEGFKSAIEDIQRAATTAATVTRQLLMFSRNQHSQLELLSLNAVIRQNEDICRRSCGPDIHWNTSLDPDLKLVSADASQLAQVLMNLVLNARDAMPGGGSITVETANVRKAGRSEPGKDAEYAMLRLSDTGIGMDDAVREHIFEPFFTTKQAGHGTGLGLSIVHTIVKHFGGTIRVDSQPRRGSTFEIFLPAAGAAPLKKTPRRGDRAKTEKSDPGTILLVDDDASVRRVMHRYLEAGGYRILVAADGCEALELACSHAGEIDLLVTDVMMPKMNGIELARQLTEMWPEIRTIFVSGYASDLVSINARSGSLKSARFLEKPFLHGDFLEQVGLVLGEDKSEAETRSTAQHA